jgi:hypothetical protein
MRGEHHNESESFPKDVVGQVSHPLELVHSDICRPMTTPSLGGAKYLLTFIDSLSHFLWIYTIQSKGDAFERFKEFKSPVENYSNHRIKSIKTDYGDEHFGDDFHPFLTSHGIVWKKPLPQQDEVVHIGGVEICGNGSLYVAFSTDGA